jgi:diguanylate cyclase (GGDEF)-like protein
VDHNQPVLIEDEAADERVNHFRETGTLDGSLIVVPLLGPSGAAGVLTLERLGRENPFDEQEFEFVKLFAGQVSIALRNAESFHAAEIRARTDDLTGLLNHGTFKDWLRRSVTAREPFGLVMIDLDEFKTVNDTLGHQTGDRLLREIASAILNAARDTDAVFRYGGDEFVVILPRTESTGLASAAERILVAVEAVGQPGTPWHAEGLRIGASIGTAFFPEDAETPEDVLLAADRACFVAKRTGHGLIATADEGLAIARDFAFKAPTPIDTVETGGEPVDMTQAPAPATTPLPAAAPAPAPAPAAGPSAARSKPRRPAADASPVS